MVELVVGERHTWRMAGETDPEKMLATLSVSVRPDTYTFCALPPGVVTPNIGGGVEALIAEAEGITVVATVERATSSGWAYEFVASWLTLDVHSALEAVGLTAAFSQALAEARIPCNVLAGYLHDHILVPVARTTEAVQVLEALAAA